MLIVPAGSDYNPRLEFRDDTPKVLERMQEVTVEGSSVWDGSFTLVHFCIQVILTFPLSDQSRESKYSPSRTQEDLLPAFSALTTDEERERKAELREAGTYMVITNPDSFACLPEYCDEDEDEERASKSAQTTALMSHGYFFDQIVGGHTIPFAPVDSMDPNVVILKAFEDIPRRTPVQLGSSESRQLTSIAPIAPSESDVRVLGISHSPSNPLSRLEEARNGGRDFHLLEHYRRYISPRIIPGVLPDVENDIFEIEAQLFPPVSVDIPLQAALSESG